MKNIRIAAVEYVNTLPFLYAIESIDHPGFQFEIIRANPAECARLFLENEVDIALVPSGAFHEIHDFRLITSYCLGADGAVDTVALLSQHPIDQIQSIYFDLSSRTSNLLIQILCKEFWKVHPTFHEFDEKASSKTARVCIGDKMKKLESRFAYKYDLGQAWKDLTNLPMVFATWMARAEVEDESIFILDQHFKKALNHIENIPLNGYAHSEYWKNYLQHSIRYDFDDQAKKGLNKFLHFAQELTH